MGYILITGASSGIGRQCAIQLSKENKLILCARRENKLLETKAMCENSENHLIFPYDLTKVEYIEKELNSFLIQKTVEIEKFLHCAGTLQLLSAKAFDMEVCDKIFKTNVFSAMAITKVLLKKNNKKDMKKIIFISALYSKKGAIGNSFYASSKGALDSYMRSIAKELAPIVKVNSILPGGINTEITNTTSEEQKKIIEKGYPLGFGETTDVANMVEFLFSPKADWITGQQILVDGGASI